MLVLSRKLGQSFRLGPDVRVTIVKIDRNSVRIGIEAPERGADSARRDRLRAARILRDQDRGRLNACDDFRDRGLRPHRAARSWIDLGRLIMLGGAPSDPEEAVCTGRRQARGRA